MDTPAYEEEERKLQKLQDPVLEDHAQNRKGPRAKDY